MGTEQLIDIFLVVHRVPALLGRTKIIVRSPRIP
jgi:hypothetical protein